VSMDSNADLLKEWLEGEGERQQRRAAVPFRLADPIVRGWLYLGVTFLAASITAGLLVCWLPTAWEQSSRTAAINRQRTLQLYGPRPEPNPFAARRRPSD
jgi:hypothetical protein